MARLRFPGRPGYRFDRIGVRYGADEARQTTDPTLAIVASIHRGLRRFRDLFGDSDEEDTEFVGFTAKEVKAAEARLQRAIKQEEQLREQLVEEQKHRFERSQATLANLAAAGIEVPKVVRRSANFQKTYKQIVNTGLVQNVDVDKLKPKGRQLITEDGDVGSQQNGGPVTRKTNVGSLKHVKLKRLSHNVDTQPVFRRPVGRPKKLKPVLDGAGDFQNGGSFESIASASQAIFTTKPTSKYKSAAKQILARAAKQAAQTGSKLLTPTHKVRKFVLPSKSSRSSRVIKPNKRFLEDDSVHQLVAKQPKLSPTPPLSSTNTSIFGMGVGSEKSPTFSSLHAHGLSLSPFNLNREKGFPAFSAAPQPSGTSSFMDGAINQKPLGSLDQPLIVEGKRPRKPSLIMRMKLVEDDPDDEIRLQQQLSDAANPTKTLLSPSEGVTPVTDSQTPTSGQSSLVKGYGTTKSILAPARLFTEPATPSSGSKSFRSHYKHKLASGLQSQSTVVLRQAKLQLNQTALNRSKAALARSLKAKLKREAKLERRKRKSERRMGLSSGAQCAVSPGSSLSQLSPFSKLVTDSAIERQKSGLFEGIEAGAGSFSPGSFGSPPVTPGTASARKSGSDHGENYQSLLITDEILLKPYKVGVRATCLVCSDYCIMKRNRKLPQVPFCRKCKKSYFFHLTFSGKTPKKKCLNKGKCKIHFTTQSIHHCKPCKFSKFLAVLVKCERLGKEFDSSIIWRDVDDVVSTKQKLRSKDSSAGETKGAVKKKKKFVEETLQDEIKQEEGLTPVKKKRHKSEDMSTPERRRKHKSGDTDSSSSNRPRQKHKSGDKIPEPASLRRPAKSPSHSKDFINANNLDKPLSVDVGQDADPFSLSPPQTLSSTKSSPGKGIRSPSKKYNGSDRASDKTDDDEDDTGRSRGSSRGPRIKHVCRRAAMVFPQQRATFPEDPLPRATLTLSALPNEEKQQLWAKTKSKLVLQEDSSTDESMDERPIPKGTPSASSPDKKQLSPKDDKQGEVKKERRTVDGEVKKEKRTTDGEVKKEKRFTVLPERRSSLSKEEAPAEEKRERRVSGNKGNEADSQRMGRKLKKKRFDLETDTPLGSAGRKKKLKLAKAGAVLAQSKTRPVGPKGYKRKIRCRQCKGCNTPECGVCVFCRDKPKFGGPGKIKKCCIHSVCLAPKIPRKATNAFIEPKSPTKTNRRDDDDNNSGDHHTGSQASGQRLPNSSSRFQDRRANNHQKMDGGGDGVKDDGGDDAPKDSAMDVPSSSTQNGLDMDGSRLHSRMVTNINHNRAVRYGKGKYSPAVEATIQLALAEVRNPFMSGGTEAIVGRIGGMKRKEKISVPQKSQSMELKPVENETAYSFDVPLKTHLIRADYRENYDVETAWSHGFSLTVTGPSCVRTLCYLCGSAGKHEMLFCIVCCNPYHSFCLEEDERPEDDSADEEGEDGADDGHHHHGSSTSNTISWCCRRCQFCHVCGQQNGLLKCHRCKDTYHPNCLGANYPTRPSRANIWVCTKCVRCKSCGATTPGVGTNATWTYDFSLCYECGKLMDKGNFCPICHKCYSDDDWESKMVQCAICESWVHAKCEELTDEMYQRVSYLPEEVQYTCRVCSTERPPYWELVLKSEFFNGLLNVLNALMGSKCTQMLLESRPPKETRRSKHKGKAIEGSKLVVIENDGSNTEAAATDQLNTSAESNAISDGVENHNDLDGDDDGEEETRGDEGTLEEHNLRTPIEQGDIRIVSSEVKNVPEEMKNVTYARHVSPRCDEEIVEKCDCEEVGSAAGYKNVEKDKAARSLRLPDSHFSNASDSSRLSGDCQALCKTSKGHSLTMDSSSNYAAVIDPSCESRGHSCDKNIKTGASDSRGRERVSQNQRVSSSSDSHTLSSISEDTKQKKSKTWKDYDTNNLAQLDGSADKVSRSCDSEIVNRPPRSMQKNPDESIPADSATNSSAQFTHNSNRNRTCTRSSPRNGLVMAGVAVDPTSFYSSPSRESVSKSLFQDKPLQPFHEPQGRGGISSAAQETNSSQTVDGNSRDSLKASVGNSANSATDSNGQSEHLFQKSVTNASCQASSQLVPFPSSTASDFVTSQSSSSSMSCTVVSTVSVSGATVSISQVRTGTSPTLTKLLQERTPVKKGTAFPSPSVSLHVSFGQTIHESLEENEDYPRDFNAIKEKIDSGSYATVEEFSEDMVRIIQALLFENEHYSTRKKQANSIRSIFIKQMERLFPWFNVNTCKLWEHNRGLPAGMLKDAVLPPSSDHTYAQWLERRDSPMSPQPSPFKKISSPHRHSSGEDNVAEASLALASPDVLRHIEDMRACLLCQQMGDDEPDHSGRLLYCGQDDWIHINCALWSAEVFEEADGSLQNVQEAVSRGKKLRCNLCQQVGATVGCCEANCRANYHFMCARADRCAFQEDKIVFCRLHTGCVSMNVISEGNFDISRRVCVDLDRIRAKSIWGKAVDPAILNVIIGSCTVESLGLLKSFLSDTEECLYPVDFRCTRIYWSTQDARRRCVYTCRIAEVKPEAESPGNKIQNMRVIHDEKHPDFIPLDQLNLENLGIPNFMKPQGKGSEEMDDVIYIGGDSVSMVTTTTTVSVGTSVITTTSTSFTMQTPSGTPSLGQIGRSHSFSSGGEKLYVDDPQQSFVVDADDPHGVTKSWPATKSSQKCSQPTVNLSGLSASTLELLNIKDSQKYVTPVSKSSKTDNRTGKSSRCQSLQKVDDDLGLVNFAERLNSAASNKQRQPSAERDRGILNSPTFLRSSSEEKYIQFKRQLDRSKSLSASPVSFRPPIRQRANSEDRLRILVSPLAIHPTARTENRASPLPNTSHGRPRSDFRARSESPFTVIKPQEIVIHDFRSASLSPPPVTMRRGYSLLARNATSVSSSSSSPFPSVPNPSDNLAINTDEAAKQSQQTTSSVTPIIEVSESEDEEMITEVASKKSNLNLSQNSEEMNKCIPRPRSSTPEKGSRSVMVEETFAEFTDGFETANVTGAFSSGDSSEESIRSILESVPPEVLEGDGVKVVVLTDTEDLSEEDIMKLASAAIESSSSDLGSGEENVVDGTKVCDGIEEENSRDGQQENNTSREEGRDDEGNSSQNDQGGSNTNSDNDHEASENGGGEGNSGGERSVGNDNERDGGDSNDPSNAQRSGPPANVGQQCPVSKPTGRGSGGTEGNGDDEDGRRPCENSDKKEKDVIDCDIDDMIEQDSEMIETSSENLNVASSSKDVTCEETETPQNCSGGKDLTCSSEREKEMDNLDERDGKTSSDLIEISDEEEREENNDEKLKEKEAHESKKRIEHSGGKIEDTTAETSEFDDSRNAASLSAGTSQSFTEDSALAVSDIEITRVDNPSLPLSKGNEEGVPISGADSQILEESPAEESDSVVHPSNADVSEDDVEIIDLSDSEKAPKFDQLEIVRVRAGVEVTSSSVISLRNSPLHVDKQECTDNGSKNETDTSMRNKEIAVVDSTPQEIALPTTIDPSVALTSNISETSNTQSLAQSRSGERPQSRGEERPQSRNEERSQSRNQERPRSRNEDRLQSKNQVRTQSRNQDRPQSRTQSTVSAPGRTKTNIKIYVNTQDTTDEESDYLMLDDFSYSETNDEEEGDTGRDSAGKYVFTDAESDKISADEEDKSRKGNQPSSIESVGSELRESSEWKERVREESITVEGVHSNLERVEGSSESAQNQNAADVKMLTETSSLAIATKDSDSSNGSDNSLGFETSAGCSGAKDVKLKSCYVALRRQDVTENYSPCSSSESGAASMKQLSVRVKKMSKPELKQFISTSGVSSSEVSEEESTRLDSIESSQVADAMIGTNLGRDANEFSLSSEGLVDDSVSVKGVSSEAENQELNENIEGGIDGSKESVLYPNVDSESTKHQSREDSGSCIGKGEETKNLEEETNKGSQNMAISCTDDKSMGHVSSEEGEAKQRGDKQVDRENVESSEGVKESDASEFQKSEEDAEVLLSMEKTKGREVMEVENLKGADVDHKLHQSPKLTVSPGHQEEDEDLRESLSDSENHQSQAHCMEESRQDSESRTASEVQAVDAVVTETEKDIQIHTIDDEDGDDVLQHGADLKEVEAVTSSMNDKENSESLGDSSQKETEVVEEDGRKSSQEEFPVVESDLQQSEDSLLPDSTCGLEGEEKDDPTKNTMKEVEGESEICGGADMQESPVEVHVDQEKEIEDSRDGERTVVRMNEARDESLIIQSSNCDDEYLEEDQSNMEKLEEARGGVAEDDVIEEEEEELLKSDNEGKDLSEDVRSGEENIEEMLKEDSKNKDAEDAGNLGEEDCVVMDRESDEKQREKVEGPQIEEVVEIDSGDEKELSEMGGDASASVLSTEQRDTTREDDVFSSLSVSSTELRGRPQSRSDEDLHEKMVEKIKAESLAKSSPGEEGPFKCPTCKRLYRTRASYDLHIKDCDFEVSTSEEEDKPIVKELRSSKRYRVANEERKLRSSSDVERLRVEKSMSSSSPSPLHEPLSIIITDEYKEEKFSPSSRDLSDDCSSVQSQDSRRSSLRKSTVTQRNAAPAHLAKKRHRDSKSTMSPDGSTCSSLLSPKSSTSRLEEKPSPKETMLEAVGLVSRRSLELSPNSDIDGGKSTGPQTRTMGLQPRISPASMTEAPKREKKSPMGSGAGGSLRPSILAGGLPKPGSSKVKSVAITYNPIVVEEVKIESGKPKKRRQKRIWWVEQPAESEEEEAEEEEKKEEQEDELSDEEGGVALRLRHRASGEQKATLGDKKMKAGKPRSKSQELSPGTSRDEAANDTVGAKRRSSSKSSERSSSKSSERAVEVRETKGMASEELPKLRSNRRLSSLRSQDKDVGKEKSIMCSNDEDKSQSQRKRYDSGKDKNTDVDSTFEEEKKDKDDTDEVDSGNDFVLSRQNLRATKEKRRMKEDDDDDDDNTNEDDEFLDHHQHPDDPLVSPLRRSRRPASTSAKLNEYLAELKREKETPTKDEGKMSKEATTPTATPEKDTKTPEVVMKRGRGRPRIYPEKERPKPNAKESPKSAEKDSPKSAEKDSPEGISLSPKSSEKRGRGRPRIYPKPESDSGQKEVGGSVDRMVSDSTENESERELTKEKKQSGDSDSGNGKVLRSSRRLRGRSASSGRRDEIDVDEGDGDETIHGKSEMSKRKGDGKKSQDVEDGDDDNEEDADPDDKDSDVDKDTGVTTRSGRSGRNQSGDGEKVKKAKDTEDREEDIDKECIDLTDNNDSFAKAKPVPKEEGDGKEGISSADTSSKTTESSSVAEVGVKSDPSISTLPLPPQIADKIKTSGQKLRIVIRSPNVIAAQKIGELLKQTAMTVNPDTTDISVTTSEPSTAQDNKQEAKDENVEKGKVDQENKAGDGTQDSDEKPKDDTPLVSRSASPDSISAAYDIQSDDFSSETSNDVDDFPPRASVTEKKEEAETAIMPPPSVNSSSANNVSNTNSRVEIVENNNDDDEDDDVVIVKAVGLQPPEPGLAQKPQPLPHSLFGHSQPKVAISSSGTFSFQHSSGLSTNTSATIVISSQSRSLSAASPVIQPARPIPHVAQPTLNVSPTQQGVHSFMNLQHQTSPPQSQPHVMISEVSPGHFILQQANPRSDMLAPRELNQSGLMLQNTTSQSRMLLQNPGQPGILFQHPNHLGIGLQTPNQSGIALQNTSQSGVIFRQTSPPGLILPQNTAPTLLQGQPSLMSASGQGSLSFISLNPSNPLGSTLISPLQSFQPHVSHPSMLQTSMGLNTLMGAASLANQPLVIGQPFLAQPNVLLPQLSTHQPMVSQHSEHFDLTRTHQQQEPYHHQLQQQQQKPQPQQHLSPSNKSSSVIIDPHAHMLSSGLNQSILKWSQSSSPPKSSPLGTTSQHPILSAYDKQQQRSVPSASAATSLSVAQATSATASYLSSSTAVTTVKSHQPISSLPSLLSRTQTTQPAPVLKKVDGAPAQVNYMGTFDLKENSSLPSGVGNASFNENASKKIMELVQSALKNQGKEQIPGVEIKTAINNTPQGPKKVFRVFINEDILPEHSSSTSLPYSSTAVPSLGQSSSSVWAGSQVSSAPEWSQILSQPTQGQHHDQMSLSNAEYVSIPISQRMSATQGRMLNRPHGSGPFRRALKPYGYLKRKHVSSSASSAEEGPQEKRMMFEKTLSSDGTCSGTIQKVVSKHHYVIEDPASARLEAQRNDVNIVLSSNQNITTTPLTHSLLQQDSAPVLALTDGRVINRIPTTISNENSNLSTQQQHHPSHQIHQQQQQQQQPPHHIAQQQQLLRSPHKRASFPLMSPAKKPSAATVPSQAIKSRIRKQKLQKSTLRKDPSSPKAGRGAKSDVGEKKKKAGGPRRLKTAPVASHHPLIHHKKGVDSLPQPSLEEEVVATPLDMGRGDHPHGPGGRGERERSQGRLRFEITSDDGFSCQGDTMEDAWNQVLEKVQDVRAAARMKQLSYAAISGRAMFGVDHDAVVYLIEQLYGAVHCHRNYKFKFHKYDLDQADAEVALNPSGAARSETFLNRKPFDMFNFLKSVYRTKPGDDEREKEEEMALKSSRRATSLSLPMAMRFRKLKTFAKEAVDVYRSKIHGRGLFCKRNIDAGEMVIEYAGEVIRASLTDKREKYYESKGIGCYMFRIDDDEVVDATMHGSAARFINHSCEPNCFSKVILVDGKKHIVIFAMRPIKRGEELTYDYKFPIEEVKIPCSCGSKKCRKYLN